jgi:hypothetical protein
VGATIVEREYLPFVTAKQNRTIGPCTIIIRGKVDGDPFPYGQGNELWEWRR